MKKNILLAVFALLFITANSHALLLTSNAQSLYNLFPYSSNGENDVYCQYYNGQASQLNGLSQQGPYIWRTTGLPMGSAWLERTAIVGNILTKPSAMASSFADLHSIMNVGLQKGSFSHVRITGSVYTENNALVYFSIYKGLANMNSPVWTIATTGTFDLTIALQNGDRLFFDAYSGNAPSSGFGHWQNVQFTGVPEPATMSLLGLGALLLRRK